MDENIISVTLFDLCDLDLIIHMGGAQARGFNTSQVIDVMEIAEIEKGKREDVLRRLKIMGSVAAESFNQKQKGSKG